MDIRGKNVLVTGGANGIGLVLVGQLLERGATVGVFDLDRDALVRLAAVHPAVYCAVCDVGSSGAVKEEVGRFVSQHQRIHALVNNAGFVYSAPLVRLGPGGIQTHDIELWDKVIRTDLSGVFYVTVYAVENMIATRTRGVVVNLSSIAAAGNAGQGAYSAAKAGINALTVAWSKELAPMKIRFVSVAPGFTKTETTIQALETNVLEQWVKQTPARRMGEPAEIAEAIVFAIANDFINGTVIEVNGGLRL